MYIAYYMYNMYFRVTEVRKMSKPAHDTITATQLVRNLSAALDTVRVTGNSLYITKGSQTVAELSPPPKTGLPLNKLVELLKALPKLGSDGIPMSKDLKSIRKKAKLPESPWD